MSGAQRWWLDYDRISNDPDGDWVRHEDHEQALAAAHAEIAALRTALDLAYAGDTDALIEVTKRGDAAARQTGYEQAIDDAIETLWKESEGGLIAMSDASELLLEVKENKR